jgi:EmrB/QacA subfamily drug resistance transporter
VDRKWWTLIAVCTGVFMLLLDITIVNVALPSIEHAFHASLSDLQWVIDAYALTLAALLLTAGSVADLAGRRLVFAVGIVVFTAGSALCGVAGSATFLSIARGLQGIGGAIMFATALALLAQAFPPRERATAFAVFGATTGVAVAIGPVLGGAITSALSWRWIFFVNLPIGVLALLVTLTRVAESKLEHAPRPDVLGFLTFSLALAGLVFGLIRSQDDGWGSATVLVSVGVFAVLIPAFLVLESRIKDPMFDLHLLRVPTFNGGLVAAFGISASIFALLTYLTIYIQNVLGYSAVQSGVRFLPFTGVIFFSSALAGRLTARVPVKALLGGGFALLTAGLLLLRGLTPADGWTHFLPGFIVSGVAVGLINVPLASTAVGVVAQERAGMASGINSTFRQIGIATGVAAAGTILASVIRSHVVANLARTPLAAHGAALGHLISTGAVGQAIAQTPARYRGLVVAASRASFVSALNEVLLIGACVAGAAAVLCVLTIRTRDFHHNLATSGSGEGEPVPVAA